MIRIAFGSRSVEIKAWETVFPILALGFSAIYYVDTLNLPEKSMLYARPVLYATAALALSVLAVFAVRINPGENDRDSEKIESIAGFTGSGQDNAGKSVIILGLAVGYVLTIRIQFAVATLVFLVAALYVLGERRRWILAAYSLGLTGVVHGIFVLWLHIPL